MAHRLTATLGIFLAAAVFVQGADPLESVFAHIDTAAKTFKGMTAGITNTHHLALTNDDDVQTGTAKLLRVKPGVTRIWIDWTGATGAQTIALDAQNARIYQHKMNTVEVYPIGDHKATVNQYLLLGFGATSSELKDTYDISYVGEEKIGDQSAAHLKLVPKSADTRRNLKQADLWFADNGLVVQQKFLDPSGDYKLAKYVNMKLGAMPESDLDLKLPKGVVTQKH